MIKYLYLFKGQILENIKETENLVKKMSKDLNINQSHLAEIMGVSRQSVNSWATNKVRTPKVLTTLYELFIIKKKYEIVKAQFSNL